MKNRFAFSLLLFISLLFSIKGYSTHLKAADLSAVVNPDGVFSANAHRIVRFTLTVYARRAMVGNSVVTAGDCGASLANCAALDFGDGVTSRPTYFSQKVLVDNDTYKIVYFFDHTYSTDRFYTVKYLDENRVNNILNVKAPSDQLPFFIQMGLMIDNSSVTTNHTPVFSVPAVDNGAVSRTYVHNVGAYDINGDSISYEKIAPSISSGVLIPEYKEPHLVVAGNNQEGTSAATYTVHPSDGTIVWDAPSKAGLYTVAILVNEWRKVGNSWVRLSYT